MLNSRDDKPDSLSNNNSIDVAKKYLMRKGEEGRKIK